MSRRALLLGRLRSCFLYFMANIVPEDCHPVITGEVYPFTKHGAVKNFVIGHNGVKMIVYRQEKV